MSEAAKARRRYRREEWATQTTLARLLTRYLDPQTVFWTSLENKPSSRLNGLLQKRRGVRSGLPDTMVVYRRRAVFVELKSKAGVASKSQKRVRAELVAAGARWCVRAAPTALHRSGVPFRAPWKPPSDLREWEGPFTGEEKRAPQHPLVREKQREACRRWREKRRAAGLKVRSEPTERRRAQTREATRRWQERARELAARLRKSPPAPEAAWPEAHPSTALRRPSPSAHQNQPEVELAWRTSRARHLESDTRRFGNLPVRVTLTELRY